MGEAIHCPKCASANVFFSKKRGHDVWFDKSEIKAGDDWRRAFAGEIETLNGHLTPIQSDARIYDLLKKDLFGRACCLTRWNNGGRRRTGTPVSTSSGWRTTHTNKGLML